MQFLTHAECWKWFRDRIQQVEASSSLRPVQVLPPSGFVERRYKLPIDSGKKVALAKLAMNLLGPEQSGLIWLQNWAIWPSSGHLPILRRYRQALGETRDPEIAPGVAFAVEEFEDATSFLIMSLEFYWDCLAISNSGRVGFYASHDEHCSFFSRDSAIVEGFDSKIQRLLL